MSEWRLFDDPTKPPECSTAEWYADRERAAHLEEPHQAGRLYAAAEFVRDAVALGANSVSDMGAGDGGLLSLIAGSHDNVRAWGYDLQPTNVKAAKEERNVDVILADFVNDVVVYGDVVACTETLEHLVDPHGLVARFAEHAQFLVASSPFSETAESHYAHHLWAWDQEGYQAMISANGWEVLDSVDIQGYGFQVVFAVRATA
jgi:2-polyprenyl-3-methyl-5-hydroxy-6-metoxy-1,4-benzoquinol methylase